MLEVGWRGVGSLKDLSKNILKQGVGKGKCSLQGEGVLKVSTPLPPPPENFNHTLYGPEWSWQNFSLRRLRPSQDSRAVGKQSVIPRSLEYRTILYNTTYVLDKL